MPADRFNDRGPGQQEGTPPAERRYRSPTIGEIFRRAGGIEVPEAMKEAARVSARSPGERALTRVFEGLGSVTGRVDERYNEVINSLRGASYTLEDIQPFIDRNAKALKSNENSGLILSAMTNNIIKEGDKIEFDSSGLLLKYVGYKLPCGTLTINGTAGDYAGYSMSGGTLTINGNARDSTGHSMSSGILTINGNAGSWAGHYMSGGTLTINGNARDSTGSSMSGGKLVIKGNSGRLTGSSMSGGTLTIKGDAGDSTGSSMSGGTLTINGNAGYEAGELMSDGILTIKGDAGSDVGYGTTSKSKGKIVVEGHAKSIAGSRGGKLFVNGEEVK